MHPTTAYDRHHACPLCPTNQAPFSLVKTGRRPGIRHWSQARVVAMTPPHPVLRAMLHLLRHLHRPH